MLDAKSGFESALAMRFMPGLVASWRELESQRLNASPGLQELIARSSSRLASSRVHKGAIIEKDFDNYQFRREGEAEEDAGAGFVSRRVAPRIIIFPRSELPTGSTV